MVPMEISKRALIEAATYAAFFFICPTPASATDCAALLRQHVQTDFALPFAAFDQNEAGGWRSLRAAGCDSEPATLIEEYAAAQEKPHAVLVCHRAQLLAIAGAYTQAILVARQTLRPEGSEADAEFQ